MSGLTMKRLFSMKALLEKHGFHVVDEKDKAVLDVMASIPEAALKNTANREPAVWGTDDLQRLAQFELARRGL